MHCLSRTITYYIFAVAFAYSIILLNASIYSQDISSVSVEKRVYLFKFSALSDLKDKDIIVNSVRQALIRNLEKKGYSIEEMPDSWNPIYLSPTASRSYPEGSVFIVGSFERRSYESNLNLFGQIIDVKSKDVIDAYSLTDDVFDIMKGDLGSLNISESDESRIERFASKIALQIQINPTRKKKYYNLDEHIYSNSRIDKDNLPLQGDASDANLEVFELLQNQVTKSATKFAKKTNEAPNIVSVIDHKEMEDYGRISLNDIIYQLPGFFPSRDFDRRTVGARGMFEGWNNNHLLMLVDGVQFNDNLYGTAYTWEITPLNMIKSVEVIRGPGSALYGSNATNGVVSLNTWSGKDLEGDVRVRVRAGDRETQIYDLLTGGTSQYLSYVVSYNSFNTQGNDQVSPDDSGRMNEFGFLEKFSIPDRRKNSTIFFKLEGEDFLEGFSFQYHRNSWNFETGHGWLWRVPDFQENMNEGRQVFIGKYSGNITSKLSQEYVVSYQERTIDWKIRFAERGAFEDFYPDGNWEILNTDANNIFGRSQWAYDFGGGMNFLVGMEANVFRYNGDRKHLSDVDYANSTDEFPPYENGILTPQGPWLEWIDGIPVPSFAGYAQFVSGRFWNRSLELTLGIRYDETYAKYRGIDEPQGRILEDIPNIPDERRVFRRTNPRAGLVYFVSDQLTFKAMGGTAFRAPSITEMFGANTFTLASNPRELKPEIITTYDFGMDWIFLKYYNFRANWFWTKFENQIAYSIQNNNLSTNIYDLTTRGIETELLVNYKTVSLFINYSWNQRMNEKIFDDTVAESRDLTTWAPDRTGNIGFRQNLHKWMYSVTMQAQGRVRRRISDQSTYDPKTSQLENPFYRYEFPRYRPDSIDPWVNMNLKIAYYFTEKISAGLFVSNAFNQDQYLIKNNLYPFDYRREMRRVLVDLSATF